ncbi:NUDIX domain-containing protein [Streptomyces sp. NPDC058045]|uniref:NUDIX hydrolase n=1 Tax=Streptomyces sp. NPDC058045 TaxID=3346311 RepID=UPI0036EF4F13
MIVWINGAFGAGKRTTARELIDLIPNSALFDPEVIGGALAQVLPPKRLAEVTDLLELPVFRRLVVDTAAGLLAEGGGPLLVPMTLLRQEHRDEIFGALAARRIPVHHVVLTPAETILRTRATTRRPTPGTTLALYRTALTGWLTADAHPIDTGHLTPREAALRIAEAVGGGAPCDIVQTPEPAGETVAAGVLLFDAADRVLLVDPTYKAGWEFPGGVVEPGEAPARAGMREVAEETGLQLDAVPRLLVVDWEAPEPPGHGGLRLLFDGGRLPDSAAHRIRLPGPELRDWRFATPREATTMLPPVRATRLQHALNARHLGTPLYLEAGREV